MSPFTVVLIRPDSIAYPHFGEDFYIAHVEAENPSTALKAAQLEVAETDDMLDEYQDYRPVVIYAGHLEDLTPCEE
jgi:hypothetical protein